MAIRHIVLFPIRSNVGDAEVADALEVLRELGNAPGVLEWRIELSKDTRKGRVLVENGLIADGAFAEFQSSGQHRRAGDVLSRIADVWLIGDYDE